MARLNWQPDMIVGIDFGMTCTGVAWSKGPEWQEPKTLQHWPGKLSHELRNKVDTAVSYSIDTGELSAWGFLCNPDDERYEQNELFKLYLDPNYKDSTGNAPSLQEARTWFRDYLGLLYKCITQHFRQSMARLDQKRIEYVFSIPTTWRDPAMIAETESIIREAGFGQPNNERASIYLTEAEAAAIYTSKLSMESGDVFLVCDIGGGTTDLNVLKVKSAQVASFELVPLSWTEGTAVGSTLIDFKMQQNIAERLRRVRPPITDDADELAAKMIQENFMSFKCSFGNESFSVADLYMPIPGMSPDQDFPDAHIFGSKMVLSVDELRAIFDQQAKRLFNLIDQQLQIVQSKHPKEMIHYLVLSGGLGSSPYIQQKVKARYGNTASVVFKNAKGIEILVAGEPQLAVVHGLVIARTQECKYGKDILTKRCSPSSYGIVCRELYEPEKHKGQPRVLDENDKKHWAVDQIAWIIKRGDTFDTSKGASHMYQMKLTLGEEKYPWKVRIAMSTLPSDELPQSINDQGARIVCEVEFELDARDFTLKNGHWYQMKKPYLTGTFEVRVIVGTGLKFEIWSKDRILSRAHDEVKVEWVPPGDIPTGAPAKDSRLYRVEQGTR